MIQCRILAIVTLLSLLLPSASRADTERLPVDEIFYQFMPISWRDSDNDANRFGDFGGMTASLDYLETLGVTAVWMNPIFPSHAYHGYQHGPGNQVNPWFGTEAQFLSFVQQAHARGIKVFLDNVVYGISQDTTWFQSAYGNPSSPYDTWLAFTNSSNTQYLGSTYTTWNGDTVGFIHWDLRNANTSGLVTQWAQHWLDPNGDGDPSDGIDGFRLDHVWQQYGSGPDGWGYNLDDFWIPWKAALQTVRPDVFIFAEQADWGIHGEGLLPAFDATMTKPFEFAARDALSAGTNYRLYQEMAATVASLPSGKTYMGIIGDHDVNRLASTIGGGLDRCKAAAAVLLTQPYPPMIYYGDEIGMLGTKVEYNSDANDIPMREPFKWNAVAGPPMSNYWQLHAQAYDNRFSRDNDGRSVQEQLNVNGSLLEAYRGLIAARKANVALRRGDYTPITNSSIRVWSFLRQAEGEQTILVAVNVFSQSQSITLDLSALEIGGGSTTPIDVITGQTLPAVTSANKAAYSMTVPAYGYYVLDLDAGVAPPPPNDYDGFDVSAGFVQCDLVATQDNATAFGDNVNELDQLFVEPAADGLRIGIPGNLSTDGMALVLLFDTISGGQNVLDLSDHDPPPTGPNNLTGMKLDAGFAADQLVFINAYNGFIYVDQFELRTNGDSVHTYRGNGTVNDGDGDLSGGTNPNGMKVALSNGNTQGVTDVDASGADTATDGFEMFIPYANINVAGLNGGTVRMIAFIMRKGGEISNQWLPGLGGGYASLGETPDMTAVPGDQFVDIGLSIKGDLDASGSVDVGDLDEFVDVLLGLDTTASRIAASDANCDGSVDGRDIADFIAMVLGN